MGEHAGGSGERIYQEQYLLVHCDWLELFDAVHLIVVGSSALVVRRQTVKMASATEAATVISLLLI